MFVCSLHKGGQDPAEETQASIGFDLEALPWPDRTSSPSLLTLLSLCVNGQTPETAVRLNKSRGSPNVCLYSHKENIILIQSLAGSSLGRLSGASLQVTPQQTEGESKNRSSRPGTTVTRTACLKRTEIKQDIWPLLQL